MYIDRQFHSLFIESHITCHDISAAVHRYESIHIHQTGTAGT